MLPKRREESLAILLLQTHLLRSSPTRQPTQDSLPMGSSTVHIFPITSQPYQKVCPLSRYLYQSEEFAVSESVFSGRTGRSRKSESTWSSVESTTSGRIVQPLSPISFVTQGTEVTISPSNSVKAVEQLARVVRISSVGTIPIQIHESPTRSYVHEAHVQMWLTSQITRFYYF